MDQGVYRTSTDRRLVAIVERQEPWPRIRRPWRADWRMLMAAIVTLGAHALLALYMVPRLRCDEDRPALEPDGVRAGVLDRFFPPPLWSLTPESPPDLGWFVDAPWPFFGSSLPEEAGGNLLTGAMGTCVAEPFVHIVERGETLTSIAQGLGLPDYRSLYDSALNRDFVSSHPDPNRIYVGDVIVIPGVIQVFFFFLLL